MLIYIYIYIGFVYWFVLYIDINQIIRILLIYKHIIYFGYIT